MHKNMDIEWLNILIQNLNLNTNNQAIVLYNNNIRNINDEDIEYETLIKQYNIKDYPKNIMTDDDKHEEYQILKSNIKTIDNYYLSSGCNIDDYDIDEFIKYNLAKNLQYKRKFCLDTNNKIYRDLNHKRKNKIKVIRKKILHNISILKNKKICRHKKLFCIKKISKAIIHFIDEEYYLNLPTRTCKLRIKEINDDNATVDDIIYKMRKLNIKKKNIQ